MNDDKLAARITAAVLAELNRKPWRPEPGTAKAEFLVLPMVRGGFFCRTTRPLFLYCLRNDRQWVPYEGALDGDGYIRDDFRLGDTEDAAFEFLRDAPDPPSEAPAPPKPLELPQWAVDLGVEIKGREPEYWVSCKNGRLWAYPDGWFPANTRSDNEEDCPTREAAIQRVIDLGEHALRKAIKELEPPAPPPRVYTSAELWDSAPEGVYKRADGYNATALVATPWCFDRVAMYIAVDGTPHALARDSAAKWLPDPTREASVTFVPAGGGK